MFWLPAAIFFVTTAPVDLLLRSEFKRELLPLGTVVRHPSADHPPGLEATSDFFETDRLLLERAPQPFDSRKRLRKAGLGAAAAKSRFVRNADVGVRDRAVQCRQWPVLRSCVAAKPNLAKVGKGPHAALQISLSSTANRRVHVVAGPGTGKPYALKRLKDQINIASAASKAPKTLA